MGTLWSLSRRAPLWPELTPLWAAGASQIRSSVSLYIRNVALSAEICSPRLYSLPQRLSCPQPPSTEGHVSARAEVEELERQKQERGDPVPSLYWARGFCEFPVVRDRDLRPPPKLTKVEEPHSEDLTALAHPPAVTKTHPRFCVSLRPSQSRVRPRDFPDCSRDGALHGVRGVVGELVATQRLKTVIADIY